MSTESTESTESKASTESKESTEPTEYTESTLNRGMRSCPRLKHQSYGQLQPRPHVIVKVQHLADVCEDSLM